jgi:tripartite-type tricarboxylate transporter receptor subunit TctC
MHPLFRSPLTLSFAAALAASNTAWSQGYPSKPIMLVVPFAAGGPADVFSRGVSAAMSKVLKQPIIIESIGGAGGTIGSAKVARAAPDGYTILYHNLGMATAPSLVTKMDYDPLESFEYIGMFSHAPSVLVARLDLPAKSFGEFLSFLKSGKERVMFANSGVGSLSHLCSLLIMNAVNTQFTTVPYKGTSQSMNDLVGGRVDVMCDAAATTAPQIKSGKIKAMGVTGRTRSRVLPGVPTLNEQGLTGFDMENWNALYAPKGTPGPVMERLSSALLAALPDPEFQAHLEKVGTEPMTPETATPAALRQHLRSEIERWSVIIKQAGITAQ